MKVISFVGASGTGKSYRCVGVAKKYHADAILDDGLLISKSKVIAGTSAKKEATKIASVKHALLMDPVLAHEIKKSLYDNNIQCVMILGTSERMVRNIADNIGIGEVSQYIHIEDEASEEEIRQARVMRVEEGKHIIPVPTFEVKKDFSGYFLHPMRMIQKSMSKNDGSGKSDKSIVRPTYSYLGDYTISDNVIISCTMYEVSGIHGVYAIHTIDIRTTAHGIHIYVSLSLDLCADLRQLCRTVQHVVRDKIEKNTSINVRRVNIFVKGIK